VIVLPEQQLDYFPCKEMLDLCWAFECFVQTILFSVRGSQEQRFPLMGLSALHIN
jgi:hypothetical protein